MTAPTPAGEWYPRECIYCTGGAALACQDLECRERGFGEHRVGCASSAGGGCDCLRTEVEQQ